MLHAHRQQHPTVGLTLHVDDLIRDFQGQPDDMLTQVDDSNALVRQHLGEIGMPLAHEKEQVVATTYRLAQQISNISLGAGRTADHTVRRLGVDYSLGSGDRRRHHSVRGQRFKHYRQRKKHIRRRFRRVASQAGRIFYGGAVPAATFGIEIHGLSDRQLRDLMSGARTVAPVRQIGVATDLLLFQHPVTHRPDFMDVAQPLLRYGREIWQSYGTASGTTHGDELTPAELHKVYAWVQLYQAGHKEPAHAPAPPRALLESMRRL
jgi:hypothetical protein